MKKAVCLLVVIVGILGLWGWKKTSTKISAILPDRCLFFVDESLSSTFQKNMTSSIAKDYAQFKNLEQVIDVTSGQFPEVHAMQVQICNTDKICFYIDAAKPVFLLNDSLVVCDNQHSVPKDHFTAEVLTHLPCVVCHHDSDVLVMLPFVQKLPDVFQRECVITWISSSDITLSFKKKTDYVLQVSAQNIPTERDAVQCQLIMDLMLAKQKNRKKSITCDLRFKNQIIVR